MSTIYSHPLFGLSVTIAAYAVAASIWKRFGAHPLLHPVLLATAMVALFLSTIGLSYDTYFHQVHLLNEALAVAVVLLAVPLSRQLPIIADAGYGIGIALVAGSVVALMGALALPAVTGADQTLLATLAPKSATAAVAVELAQQFGGAASLTAVIVISTGIFGAVFGPSILRSVGVDDDRALGFALGVASHAIGTARAFQVSEVAGVFASLGMILNALLTITLVPIVFSVMGHLPHCC